MDLVLQAPAIDAADVAAIATLTAARGIHALPDDARQAFRLTRVDREAGIAEMCAAAGIDWALVPPDLTMARVRVLAIDMDSTLITVECIDEIADTAGIRREVAAITESAMRGEIDFRESLERRVALLAGLPVAELQRVYDERIALSPGAEKMLAGFRSAGARTLLVSGGFTFFTDRLKSRLGFDESMANGLEIAEGRLTGRLIAPIVDARAKAAALVAMRHATGDRGIAVAIGDGANDLQMLEAADFSIAYHAKPVVRTRATCAIDACGLDAVLNLFA